MRDVYDEMVPVILLSFASACRQEQEMEPWGTNCFKNNDPVHSTFLGCYGKACEKGSFSSPNYPQDYETRDKTFMALYIPHAKSIFFDFSSPFCVEEGKDELYVGSGLEIYFGDIDDLDNLPENWYHFDGSGVPSNFTLQGTDTTFVYFSSDKSTVCEGFNITWEAQVDYTPPVVSSCPSDQETTVNAEPTELDWDEPTAYTTDGDDIYMTSNFPEDNEAPIFHNCPNNMFHFVTYPNTSLHVYWVEPNVTDNMVSVNDIILVKTQSPGDLFENGTHSVQYTASDPYGNQEHCNFIIEILIQGDDQERGSIAPLLPLIICGVIFTIISCVCCLGRSVKRAGSTRDTTSKSNNKDHSTGNSTGQNGGRTPRSSRLSSARTSSIDNGGFVFNESSEGNSTSSGSSGYISGGKSIEAIYEEEGTHL
ncbi:putative hyalin-like [Apostichopus japonicus]|uniref:Putative hyalin-like n=1 Tax=Stichopus japonicus TaxID=307972 RepID=A0A2G8JCG5_STIJA|nr:putative hyalin-like [Apostichopus japonicus]